MQLAKRWIAWQMRSKRRKAAQRTGIRCRRGPLESIWKGRFSAISGAEFILRNIWSNRLLKIFDELWHASRGHARIITIAPEIPGAMEVIAEAARRGMFA